MGWVHNLKDPNVVTRAPRLIAIGLVFPIVACVAVSLRFYVRFYTKRRPWYDDYASLSSTILGVAYAGIAIAQTRWGLGLDAQEFPLENLVPSSKLQYAAGAIYNVAVLGFKIALLASYLRIGGFIQTYSYAIYGVMAACTCNQLAFTFVVTLACQPVAKQWDYTIPGHCIDAVKSYYALAGTGLGFDILIILLPIPVLLRLQLNVKQKAVLVAIFSLGFFVTIIQIIRLFTLKNLKTYTDSESSIIWSICEISVGVIVSCIPTYAPLFRSFAQRMSSGRGTSRVQHQTGSRYLRSKPTGDTFDRPNTVSLASKSKARANAQELKTIKDRQRDLDLCPNSWKTICQSGSEEHIIAADEGKIYSITEVTVERQDTAES